MKVAGKNVLITGASAGLGADLARAIARHDGQVVLLARTEEALQKVVDEIREGGGTAIAYAVDLTDPKAISELTPRITDEVGIPDIVINNAGAGVWRFVEETNPEDAIQLMGVPYLAAYYVTHAFMAAMRTRNSGQIVNVTSPVSRIAWPGATGYGVARWAVRGFTELLRADLATTAITVSLVQPPYITNSEYFQRNPGSLERLPKIAKLVPGQRSEQLAEAIVKGIERNRNEIVPSFSLKCFFILHHVLPWLTNWLMITTSPVKAPAVDSIKAE